VINELYLNLEKITKKVVWQIKNGRSLFQIKKKTSKEQQTIQEHVDFGSTWTVFKLPPSRKQTL
jgi:hypothetical protein